MAGFAIDDRMFDSIAKPTVTESKYGTRRTNGKTSIQMLRAYKKNYGEKEYVKMLMRFKMKNPRSIKVKDTELSGELKKAGLQE